MKTLFHYTLEHSIPLTIKSKRMRRTLLAALTLLLALPSWLPASAQAPESTSVENRVGFTSRLKETATIPSAQIQKQFSNNQLKDLSKLRNGQPTVSGPQKAPGDKVLVTPPAGKTIEEWSISTKFEEYDYGWQTSSFPMLYVGVVIDGNDIYICGLSYFKDTAWIKGTLNGTTATFPTGQYYGSITQDGTEYDFWFVGRNTRNNIDDVTFTYNETNKTLTLSNRTIYEAPAYNSSATNCYFRLTNTVLTKYQATGGRIYCDGSRTASPIPIDGYRLDMSAKGQMIYPSNMLGIPVGAQITAVTFYATATPTYQQRTNNYGYATASLSIGETTASTIASISAMTSNRNSMNQVFNANFPTGNSTFRFSFSSPYTYNGGNLMLDLASSGNNYFQSNFAWYGSIAPSGSSYYSTTSSIKPGEAQSFLPKIKIEYTYTNPGVDKTLALKDSTFFAGINYAWTDSATNTHHTSNLNQIATDPDQIIAMVREVYMNKDIPGNYKRGYDIDRTDDVYNDVYYCGVGQITINGSASSANSYSYSDGYGWNIPGDLKFGQVSVDDSEQGYFSHMDTQQYKPNEEGLTLLLAEMVDDYSNEKVDAALAALPSNATPYDELRTYMKHTVKSMRVVSQAKRTGHADETGTLFKIDCDKMNKFFMLAKGQVRWVSNSFETVLTNSSNNTAWLAENFCTPPAYITYSVNNYSTNSFIDKYGYPMFYHMFEQFSPMSTEAEHGRDDIYQDLINMESFGVIHDCASIPSLNHHFMMYGEDSDAADCADVRDMMFFIPDYRMMRGYGRDNVGNPAEKYLNYNLEHQPTMGLYVIRQDEITGEQVGTDADSLYRLNLNWRTNLDDFLPSDEQEYELFQVVVDDDGNETYVPVYYRNANGEYTDSLGNVLADQSNPVPIVLHMGSGADKSYPDVFVDMLANSQVVTYAIRGCDTGHFLSLKMSNQQSYVIPGLDKNEKLVFNDATYYSRYNPKTQKNCYSNKLVISNDELGLRIDNIQGGNANSTNATALNIYRMHNETVEGESQTVKELVVTLKVRNKSNGTMWVTWDNQASQEEFPYGESDKDKENKLYAGYHANTIGPSDVRLFGTITRNDGIGYMNFNINNGPGLVIYDNFTVDVSENKHPGLYQYKIETNYTDPTITDGGTAYSNTYRVPVHKTMSQISGSFTKEYVDADTSYPAVGNLPGVEFGANLRYSSKTDILRYDAYRWSADEERFIIDEVYENDGEQDLPPTGIAGNQDGSYTVSMNDVENEPEYYTTSEVTVAPGETDKWATFVDKYADDNPGAYVYAPVIEAFAVGKGVDGTIRRDYNTYGGPLQNAASGRIDVTQNDTERGRYNFYKNGVAYCYYTMSLDWKTIVDTVKLIPKGYDIYKIRAWRKIDRQYLGEQLSDREARMGNDNGEYLFEEFTYPDVSKDTQGTPPALGSIAAGENNEKTGTFGAIDVNAQGAPVTEIPVTFVVRLYFTSEADLNEIPNNLQGAPRRAGELVPADGRYYISEIEINTSLKGGSEQIVTAVNDLNYREVEQVLYYNPTGMVSDHPFDGVNMVVTRYTDGTTSTKKVVK